MVHSTATDTHTYVLPVDLLIRTCEIWGHHRSSHYFHSLLARRQSQAYWGILPQTSGWS